jgi:NAD(P)-dependent dehydrogenase (short-subunit alcohol dehydrogenase family)
LTIGNAEGIGLATALRFVAKDAYVFITGLDQVEILDSAAQQIDNSNVTTIQVDVSRHEHHDNVYKGVQKQKGKLDVVFANAASADTIPLESITEQYFDDMFNINVKEVLFAVQEALPILSDGASIILNASIATIKGPPASSIYSATKARSWAFDI